MTTSKNHESKSDKQPLKEIAGQDRQAQQGGQDRQNQQSGQDRQAQQGGKDRQEPKPGQRKENDPTKPKQK